MSTYTEFRLDEIEQRIRELDAAYAHHTGEDSWDSLHGNEYGELLQEYRELTGTRFNS